MASKPNASKMGRPSIYTPELAEKICELIRDGVSERKICGMPPAFSSREAKKA